MANNEKSIGNIIENTNLNQLKEKNIQFLEYYKNEAHKTLRYMFVGQLLPEEIQDIMTYCVRNIDTLKSTTIHTLKSGKDFKIIEKKGNYSDNECTFLIRDHQGIFHEVDVSLGDDLEGGKFPARQFSYNKKKFKQVPVNGNVYSHSIHQQDHIEECTSIDEQNNLISSIQAKLINAFNPKHDLPEILSGDDMDGVKEASKYSDEVINLDHLFDHFNNKPHTHEDILLLKHIASHFDGDEKVHQGKQTLFKAYERINYMNDAFRIFNNPQFFNGGLFFAGDIIASGVSNTFLKNITTLLPTHELSGHQHTNIHELPALEIPSIYHHFKKNKERINTILGLCKDNQNANKSSKKNFEKHIQDREQVKTHLGIQ